VVFESLVCSAAARTKTTLGIFQVWCDCLEASCSTELGIHFSLWCLKAWSAVLQPGRKLHWVFSSFGAIARRHLVSLNLAYICPKRLRRMTWVSFQETRSRYTHKSAKEHFLIQGFQYFMSDFITACRFPSLQCFDSYGDFACSDGIFLTQMYLLCVYWRVSD